jgi:hypothetical protein
MDWMYLDSTLNPLSNMVTHVNYKCHIVDLSETEYNWNNPSPPPPFIGPILALSGYLGCNYGDYDFGPTLTCGTAPNLYHINTLKRDARIPLTIWHTLHVYDAGRNPYNDIANPVTDAALLNLFRNNLTSNCNDW